LIVDTFQKCCDLQLHLSTELKRVAGMREMIEQQMKVLGIKPPGQPQTPSPLFSDDDDEGDTTPTPAEDVVVVVVSSAEEEVISPTPPPLTRRKRKQAEESEAPKKVPKPSSVDEPSSSVSSKRKPTTCNFCGYKFTKPCDVVYHTEWTCQHVPKAQMEQRKKAQKKMVCIVCKPPRTFTAPKAVDVHNKSFHRGKKYNCPGCSETFSVFSTYLDHLLTSGHRGG
jgi:hypothetical protein